MRLYTTVTLLFLSLITLAQGADSTRILGANDTIRIGVKHAPPFVAVDESGVHGPIVDFWERIDREHYWKSEFIEYESVDEILTAIASGEIDMSVNPVTVTPQRLSEVHFTQPFYITDTAVVQQRSNRYVLFIRSIFTWKFISGIFGLGIIILIFGFIIWVIERRRNHEFRKGIKGIGDGFWWSAVTMTTVGYGDKAPKTGVGRAIAFIWMITAVVGISGLTAGIASSLTAQHFETEIKSVRDLKSYRVVTVKNTSTSDYLTSFGVPFVGASSVVEALEILKEGEADYVIYDRVLVNYAIAEMTHGDELEVLKSGIRTDYYSFPINKQLNIIDRVNLSLVRNLNGMDWIAIREFYGLK
ncbi:MAG: transporter substrate-binding domain-containing protein [Flavobacteriia bacterium]|nr:transporter substrate-binding domain-containing protein [Flavobacteriia bacterium]